MDEQKHSELVSALEDLLDPWYRSLENPKRAQEETFQALLEGYEKTEYGSRFGRPRTIEEFRSSFPILRYKDLLPLIEKVKLGNYSALLPEPVARWVMTRGTTGEPKVLPTTETHLSQIFSNGARAIVNYALKNDIELLGQRVLNLNFPSEVEVIKRPDGRADRYGYSSGTYAKLFPELGDAGLIPRQEAIDALGSGITKRDWERRFELAFNLAKETNVGSVMGVTPVIADFARFLKEEHGLYPKDVWKMKALFCTSVAKIHTKYSPMLHHFYGNNVRLVEMYTATEGVFGQQLDSHPYISPNYDTFLFEVRTRHGRTKLLCDMQRGEWGRIVISSVLFPRYEIGDLVQCEGGNYFRIFGRDKMNVIVEHVLFNILSGRFSSV